ncbi:MAG: hypothetical protein IJB25_11985 [Clostridia bacterium]|nr:hypothetical protein [Clostridia bacterium]
MKCMKSAKCSMTESLFLLVAGLVLGILFTFGMPRWNAPISRDEAIKTTAAIRSVEAQYGRRHHLKEIRIEFQDHDPLTIDGSCADSELLELLHQLPGGTVIEMSIHPESDVILEMYANGAVLMDFDRTVEILGNEVTGFVYLGLFCFAVGFWGLINLRRFF